MAAPVALPPVALPPNRRRYDEVTEVPSYTPLLPKICALLVKLSREGDAIPLQRDTPFGVGARAPCSIADYLIRICKYGRCSPEVFPMLLLVLDRFLSRVTWKLSSLNAHRCIAAAFITAVKLSDDYFHSNKYYSTLLGLPLKDLNELERQMLDVLGWGLFVDSNWYEMFISALNQYEIPEEEVTVREPRTGAITEALQQKEPPAITDALQQKEPPQPIADDSIPGTPGADPSVSASSAAAPCAAEP